MSFRRRAEERERALKKMLIELAEVSSSEVERRLVAATRRGSRSGGGGEDGEGYTEDVGDLLGQALGEEFDVLGAGDAGSYVEEEMERRREMADREERGSVRSVASNMTTGKTGKAATGGGGGGWGRWIWGSVKKQVEEAQGDEVVRVASAPGRRAASVSAAGLADKRKGVRDDMFSHPPPILQSPRDTQRELPRITSKGSIKSNRSVSLQGSASRMGPFGVPDVSSPGTSASTVANWHIRRPSPTTSMGGGAIDLPASPRTKSIPEVDAQKRTLSNTTTDGPQKTVSTRNVQRTQQQQQGRSRATSNAGHAPPQKAGFLKEIRDTAERIVGATSSDTASHAVKKNDDAGPVEMDTIVPLDSQPPTLGGGVGRFYDNEHLTDRFGFIYDKRRESLGGVIKGSWGGVERKHTAALERMEERQEGKRSRPETPPDGSAPETESTQTPKRWQDFPVTTASSNRSSGSTSPVLQPSASDSNVVISSMASPIPTSSLLSRPSVSLTSPALTTSTTAFPSLPNLATTTPSSDSTLPTSSAEAHTIRLLLGQLSDVHDSLQRDRQLKWNEFLRKIRSERNNSSTARSTRNQIDDDSNRPSIDQTPESLLSDGELIGIATLGTEGRGGKQRWKEFRSLVLGGIPVAYRHKIWTECSGASSLKIPGYYEDLLTQPPPSDSTDEHDDALVTAQIEMDITRTLTDNVFFRSGPGKQKLRQVLIAYSRRNREVGYCQGMNMIAAMLLLSMPTEEDAFWVLCCIIERVLPKTYFEPNLLASRADQQVTPLPSFPHPISPPN